VATALSPGTVFGIDFQTTKALMPSPAMTKKTAIPTITQTPAGVLDALPPSGTGVVPFEVLGKDFAINPLFHPI
jgi:hypothetical protein